MVGGLPEIYIGKLKVIQTQSLLIQDGESATVSFQVENLWRPTFIIRFTSNAQSKEPGISVGSDPTDPQKGIIEFVNWANSLGTALKQPLQVGVVAGISPLYLVAAHWKIGSTNSLQVQFLVGTLP